MGAAAAVHSTLFACADGWHLAPEGAVVHHEERVAVVADVHLGYEWARGRGGDCLPAHSLAETRGKLESLLTPGRFDRLIVAGDLVESRRWCTRTTADVANLTTWLDERGIALVALAGNHDPPRRPALPDRLEIAGWTIAHGHRRLDASRTITGHHHPALRAGGVASACFLVGPKAIVLPAFSSNAAGLNLASGACRPEWAGRSLRCVAPAGDEWLDFGPLDDLARRLK